MQLSSLPTQVNSNYTDAAATENPQALEQGLKNGMDAVLGKQPGQSITGEVISRSENEILIALGKNQFLQAKLEGNMSPQPGELLTFLIKNNSGSKVILSPLFENIGQNPNIARAISAAGLPQNETTVNMVKSMMEEGLPVDRQSLYQMNRLINANPQANIQTLVQMQRLQLPITPENIFQFEAYKNYQHQLGESLMDIADAFSQTFSQMSSTGNVQEGLSFYSQILGLFTREEAGTAGQMPTNPGEIINQEILGQEVLTQEVLTPEVLTLEATVSAEDALFAENVKNVQTGLNEGGKLLPEETLKELVQQLQQAGLPDKFIQSVAQKNMSSQAFLQEIESFLKSDSTLTNQESVLELLDGKPFKSILKDEMSNQWLLQPEEVAQENSVDKLYERLNSQMNRLNQILSQSVKADTPIARTVAQVSGNIDFMNQLNQMFTYIQLPLKMQGREANGELFVYTNKKSLANKEGAVSALLHLDMEHLGSVDVHVSLNNQKVSTKFYLEDDSSLDLIANHIDMLNERLERRGYSMNAEFLTRDGTQNVMDEMLSQSKNISVLAGYSFDARA